MDTVLGFLVLMLYLLAASLSQRKKKPKKTQARTYARPSVNFGDVFSSEEKNAGGPAQSAARRREPVHSEEGCRTERMYLHEATQQQMHLAAEGEDPCHAGKAPADEHGALFSYDDEANDSAELAQDVLRGVIMSEILARPSERRALRKSGRRAV